jgi:hypothetical protein
VTGVLLSGGPAVAFVGSAELSIGMVRRTRGSPLPTPAPAGEPSTVDAPPPSVAADNQDAAVIALRATLAAGSPLSGRQLESRFGLTRAEATRVRELVAAGSNGHTPTE